MRSSANGSGNRELARRARRSWRSMRADPSHWRKYYHGTGRSLDTSAAVQPERPHPLLLAAAGGRRRAASDSPPRSTPASPPLALLSQYLPAALRRGARRRRSHPASRTSSSTTFAGCSRSTRGPATRIETTKGLRHEEATEHASGWSASLLHAVAALPAAAPPLPPRLPSGRRRRDGGRGHDTVKRRSRCRRSW